VQLSWLVVGIALLRVRWLFSRVGRCARVTVCLMIHFFGRVSSREWIIKIRAGSL